MQKYEVSESVSAKQEQAVDEFKERLIQASKIATWLRRSKTVTDTEIETALRWLLKIPLKSLIVLEIFKIIGGGVIGFGISIIFNNGSSDNFM
jgi:hypothetical protein